MFKSYPNIYNINCKHIIHITAISLVRLKQLAGSGQYTGGKDHHLAVQKKDIPPSEEIVLARIRGFLGSGQNLSVTYM